MKTENKRIYYFDVLRIVAIAAVILLHISGQNFRNVDIHSGDWHAFNVYESMSRFGVALFTMISGALFLSADHTIKRILKKNVLRIAAAFFFWSAVYLLVFNSDWSIPSVTEQLFCGYFHMWYLYAIIGLYLLVPILRVIVEKPKIASYFLVLCFLFAYVLPQLATIVGNYSYTLGKIADYVLGNINLRFVMGLTGYFVLGYMLHHHALSKRICRLLYAGGILAFVINVLGTIYFSYRNNIADTMFYESMSVTTLILAMAVFVWFRQHVGENGPASERRKKAVVMLSTCSFGVYLVHPLWIDILKRDFGLDTCSFSGWLSVPALFVLVSVLSLLVSLVLNHIPLIRNYVV